jgi:hypothetical protein
VGEVGTAHDRVGEHAGGQVRVLDGRAGQIGPAEHGARRPARAPVDRLQACIAQAGARDIGAGHVRQRQVGADQAGPLEQGVAQIRLA